MNIQTITAPAYWASALVNGDFSSLTTEECIHVNHWRKLNNVYAVLSCEEESRFTRHFQLYDPLADCSGGDVLDFVCEVRP